MSKKDRFDILNYLYSKSGLNFNIGRISIGSSDYSAEVYTYDDVENDTELKHFSIKKDLKYIIPIIKEIIEINPDIKIFASPWSPPAWMKTGSGIGGGYMRQKYITTYADYFVKFIKAYEDCGIKIFAVTPQNEPETAQSGQMPACILHPDLEAEFVITLKQKFIENNIDTKIWCYDHNFSGCGRVDWCLDEYPLFRQSTDGVAFHYYSGQIEQTKFLKDKYPELTLNFTEGGPRLFDNYSTDWCKWALMMIKVLNNGYSSFTGWNLMLDETGGPNVGPFFCGGLITKNSLNGELSYSGQYKAFRHISPYISQNSKVYPITVAKNNLEMSKYPKQEIAIEGCIIENPDNETVLLLVNKNEEKAQIQYIHDEKCWYIELLPDTVSTVLFK